MPEVGLSPPLSAGQDFAHVVGYVGPVSDKDLDELENPDPLLQIPKFQIGKIGVETLDGRHPARPRRAPSGSRSTRSAG